MYCRICGEQIHDEAIICPKCGCATGNKMGAKDEKNIGWAILGFFFPLIGLILYLIWKNDYPLRAKSTGQSAFIGFVSWILIYILILLVSMVVLSSTTTTYY